jgi:hypothetical protein
MREEGDPEFKNRKKTEERFNKSDSHTYTFSDHQQQHAW